MAAIDTLYDSAPNYAGTAVFTFATLISLILVFYQRKPGQETTGAALSKMKLSFLAALYSFLLTLSYAFMLNDQASTVRGDGIEVIYVRWIFYTATQFIFAIASIIIFSGDVSPDVDRRLGFGNVEIITTAAISSFGFIALLASVISTENRGVYPLILFVIFTVIRTVLHLTRSYKKRRIGAWLWFIPSTLVIFAYGFLVIISYGGVSEAFDDYKIENWLYFVYDFILLLWIILAIFLFKKFEIYGVNYTKVNQVEMGESEDVEANTQTSKRITIPSNNGNGSSTTVIVK